MIKPAISMRMQNTLTTTIKITIIMTNTINTSNTKKIIYLTVDSEELLCICVCVMGRRLVGGPLTKGSELCGQTSALAVYRLFGFTITKLFLLVLLSLKIT
jgi:hypothetical protein